MTNTHYPQLESKSKAAAAAAHADTEAALKRAAEEEQKCKVGNCEAKFISCF
jgi:hypothetical protein